MRLHFKSFLPSAALLSAGLMLTLSANASPITGGFSLGGFGGSYVTGTTATGFTNNGTALTATGLDFGAAGGGAGNGFGTNGTALVANASGSFMGLTMANIADILLGATANPYTSNPFISFTGSNLMVSFSDAAITRSTLGTSVTIAGTAVFSDGIAADGDAGTFSLVANSQDGTSTGTQLTFTSNVAAPAAVAVTPEPSSLALLGTGLIGAASMALRRRKLSA